MLQSPTMPHRRLLSSLLAAALLGSAAVAQHASGFAYGFDDKPCRGVTVKVLNKAGGMATEFLTDENGAFAVDLDVEIGALVLQNEGVSLHLPLPKGSATGLEARFARERFFTVRGHVVDPGGAPAIGYDLLFRDEHSKSIVGLTTDERGAFFLRSNVDVHDVLVDPCGWQHVEAGPFTKDRGLAIDLRPVANEYFCLRGHAFDDQDRPAANWRLQARGNEERVAWTRVAADGSFALWSRRPIDQIEAWDGVPLMGRAGPWQASAKVDLRERDHAFVLVTGRVFDAKGRVVAGAYVYPSIARVPPSGLASPGATTDKDGRFILRTLRDVPLLWVAKPGHGVAISVDMPAPGKSVEVRLK